MRYIIINVKIYFIFNTRSVRRVMADGDKYGNFHSFLSSDFPSNGCKRFLVVGLVWYTNMAADSDDGIMIATLSGNVVAFTECSGRSRNESRLQNVHFCEL